MKEIFRSRLLVKLAFKLRREENTATTPQHLMSEFQKLNKKYSKEDANIALAVASGRNYILYDKDIKGKQIINISHTGVMLMQNNAFYLGEIIDTLSKLVPITTVLISLGALAVSIIALLR